MTCNHPRNQLIGTASGVKCRACGRVMSAEEWLAMLHPPDERTAEDATQTTTPPQPKARGRRKKGSST